MARSGAQSSTSSEGSRAKPRGSASGALPDLRLERLLWSHGVCHIAGIDEAGRGAWAGPVVAAAVILPNDERLIERLLPSPPECEGPAFPGVRDSKQLVYAQRVACEAIIREVALDVGVGIVPATVVDEAGLAVAGQLAFWRAVCNLKLPPDHVLVDGFPLWSPRYSQTAVIQGDARCLSIAAASVVAKVTRDCIMAEIDREAPGYAFARNRGYGTAVHAEALRDLGPSPHHRRSYAPVAATLSGIADA